MIPAPVSQQMQINRLTIKGVYSHFKIIRIIFFALVMGLEELHYI